MIRFLFVFTVLMPLIFIHCEKDEPIDHANEVSIQVENHLSVPIDTFKVHFNTTMNEDSLLVIKLEPGQTSDRSYFEDVTYHYFNQGDIFLVKKGWFKIENKDYYISNCFCDPGLLLDTLDFGKLSIKVEKIDTLRKTVQYMVIKD